MPTRFIETPTDVARLHRFLAVQKLPMRVSISHGGKRTAAQNRLNRQWMIDIAEQMDGATPEEARGYCKLHFGVPILRNENEAFKEEYDKIIMPMPYEHKLRLMQVPFDFGVTRLMTVKQQTAYLDAVQRYFAEQGIVLTDPEGLLKRAEDMAA